MVDFDFDTSGWHEATKKLREDLERQMRAAMVATGRALAAEAKTSHSYQDRTGDLTRSIRALPIDGRFLSGSLNGGAIATMRYASYVEEGTTRARAYQYLSTAYVLQRTETEQRFNEALEAPLRDSGLI